MSLNTSGKKLKGKSKNSQSLKTGNILIRLLLLIGLFRMANVKISVRTLAQEFTFVHMIPSHPVVCECREYQKFHFCVWVTVQ